MKEKEINVLMVEPGKHPVVTTVENNLDALQKAVSIGAESQGLIELIWLEKGVLMMCHEGGKLLGLAGNRRIGGDVIAGVFYIIGEDSSGELCSLSKKMMEKYMDRFWDVEYYTPADVEQALFMRLF